MKKIIIIISVAFILAVGIIWIFAGQSSDIIPLIGAGIPKFGSVDTKDGSHFMRENETIEVGFLVDNPLRITFFGYVEAQTNAKCFEYNRTGRQIEIPPRGNRAYLMEFHAKKFSHFQCGADTGITFILKDFHNKRGIFDVRTLDIHITEAENTTSVEKADFCWREGENNDSYNFKCRVQGGPSE